MSLITARLREAGITSEEEVLLMTSAELLQVLDPSEVHDLIVRLRAQGKAVANYPGRLGRVPSERNIEIFRLRIVEGRTLKATGEAVGISRERVRQLLNVYFGVTRVR